MLLRRRRSSVWIARASYNLGYAGAINAVVDQLRARSDWNAIWILNPDARPTARALVELMQHAIVAGKGMVGSTLVNDENSDWI